MKELYKGQLRESNPRLQCAFCGKWKRQLNSKRERIMVNAEMADPSKGPTWCVVDPRTNALADVCVEHYEALGSLELSKTAIIDAKKVMQKFDSLINSLTPKK